MLRKACWRCAIKRWTETAGNHERHGYVYAYVSLCGLCSWWRAYGCAHPNVPPAVAPPQVARDSRHAVQVGDRIGHACVEAACMHVAWPGCGICACLALVRVWGTGTVPPCQRRCAPARVRWLCACRGCNAVRCKKRAAVPKDRRPVPIEGIEPLTSEGRIRCANHYATGGDDEMAAAIGDLYSLRRKARALGEASMQSSATCPRLLASGARACNGGAVAGAVRVRKGGGATRQGRSDRR